MKKERVKKRLLLFLVFSDNHNSAPGCDHFGRYGGYSVDKFGNKTCSESCQFCNLCLEVMCQGVLSSVIS